MKKLLILAYDFPPYVSVGGLRPHYWFENFKEMGVFPILITRNWNPIHGNELDYIQPSDTNQLIIEENEKGILIKTPYKATLSNRLNLKGKKDKFSNLLKKISTGYNETGQWFLPIGTKYELYKAAKNYLKENKVDIILATGDPYILFKYASKLSKKFKIPWVADYRDPWSQSASRRKSLFNKLFTPSLEKKYLKNVNLIITVSEGILTLQKHSFPDKNIFTIPNGYNENILNNINLKNQNSELLTIALAGSIYNWHPYKIFLETIDTYLYKNKKALAIKLYGINKQEEINKIIETSKNLKDVVEIFPKLPYNQILTELSDANVLLLFQSYTNIGVGTKVYDYLALNRKVLFCFENDSQANILREKLSNKLILSNFKNDLIVELLTKTDSGIIVKDSQDLYQVLDNLFYEFENSGYIANNTLEIETYSRKVQTEKLINYINSIFSS